MKRLTRPSKEKRTIHINRTLELRQPIRIEEVRIDAKGRLFVRPEPGSEQLFELVYRAAMGVHWHEESESFVTPTPEDLSYVEWFEKVVAAVRDEYGRQLAIDDATRWNVPTGVRRAIESELEPAGDPDPSIAVPETDARSPSE